VVTAASGDVVRDALARHPRVWLVLSRPQPGDEQRLLGALVRHGRVTFERRAARALVVRVDRAPHA
jgi:hypothetical protein